MNQRKLPFVWELDNKGVVSHAIGTYHVTENCYKEDANQRLRGKSNLLVEIRAEDVPIQTRTLISRIKLSEGIEKLTQPEQKELVSYIPGSSLEELKDLPTACFTEYLMHLAGFRNLVSLEETFLDVALKKDMPVNSLEIAYIDRLVAKIRNNTDELRQAIKFGQKCGSIPQSMREMYLAYQAGNEKRMEQLAEKHMEKLDLERNENMTEKSLPHLQRPSIVAVGVAHFLFEPSMLTLYRQKGIEVKRIQ